MKFGTDAASGMGQLDSKKARCRSDDKLVNNPKHA
jgi:hypothetical protein